MLSDHNFPTNLQRVVTFEPAKSGRTTSSSSQAPILRGVRSRVVNAKRTVLSKGVRKKVEKDNKGLNEEAFNTKDEKRLVRGFFGHTRFATSSKASMDGTHPHQWSPRQYYSFYPFQSAAACTYKHAFRPKPELIGVENFVTHNGVSVSFLSCNILLFNQSQHKYFHILGDFEFYKINGKYYDTDAVQNFLVKTLRVPMPSTVDSAAIAGMMDLLRVQGSFALSARYAICLGMGNGSLDMNPMDSSIEHPTVKQYEEIGKVFETALNEMVDERRIKSLEEFSLKDEEQINQCINSSSRSSNRYIIQGDLRDHLVNKIKRHVWELAESKSEMKSAFTALANFVSMDIETGGLEKFVRATVNAFFDNDLLHSMRIFLDNAKGSFGLCVTTSMDAHRQVVFAAKGQTLSIAFYPRKGVICYGSEAAAVKAGLNYEAPQKSMVGTDFKCVDENAVRLDLDDLGGEIVSCFHLLS